MTLFMDTPCRKSCMWFSSFPNTTTILNFKPISLAAIEFWKRYHQTAKIRVLRPGLKVAPCYIVFISTTILMGLGGPPFTICTKYGFLVSFRRFWPAQSSPATKILHAVLFGPLDHYKNKIKQKTNSYFWFNRHELSDMSVKPPKNLQLLNFTEQGKWSILSQKISNIGNF